MSRSYMYPYIYPYTYVLPGNPSQDAEKWCSEQFGPRDGTFGANDAVWAIYLGEYTGTGEYAFTDWNHQFCFKNEKDAALFVLKWL